MPAAWRPRSQQRQRRRLRESRGRLDAGRHQHRSDTIGHRLAIAHRCCLPWPKARARATVSLTRVPRKCGGRRITRLACGGTARQRRQTTRDGWPGAAIPAGSGRATFNVAHDQRCCWPRAPLRPSTTRRASVTATGGSYERTTGESAACANSVAHRRCRRRHRRTSACRIPPWSKAARHLHRQPVDAVAQRRSLFHADACQWHGAPWAPTPAPRSRPSTVIAWVPVSGAGVDARRRRRDVGAGACGNARRPELPTAARPSPSPPPRPQASPQHHRHRHGHHPPTRRAPTSPVVSGRHAERGRRRQHRSTPQALTNAAASRR